MNSMILNDFEIDNVNNSMIDTPILKVTPRGCYYSDASLILRSGTPQYSSYATKQYSVELFAPICHNTILALSARRTIYLLEATTLVSRPAEIPFPSLAETAKNHFHDTFALPS